RRLILQVLAAVEESFRVQPLGARITGQRTEHLEADSGGHVAQRVKCRVSAVRLAGGREGGGHYRHFHFRPAGVGVMRLGGTVVLSRYGVPGSERFHYNTISICY